MPRAAERAHPDSADAGKHHAVATAAIAAEPASRSAHAGEYDAVVMAARAAKPASTRADAVQFDVVMAAKAAEPASTADAWGDHAAATAARAAKPASDWPMPGVRWRWLRAASQHQIGRCRAIERGGDGCEGCFVNAEYLIASIPPPRDLIILTRARIRNCKTSERLTISGAQTSCYCKTMAHHPRSYDPQLNPDHLTILSSL